MWRLELELENADYVHAQGDTLLFSLGLSTHYVNGTTEGQVHVVSYNPAGNDPPLGLWCSAPKLN